MRPLGGLVVHLQRPHSDGPLRGQQVQRVAHRQGARPQRSRDDRAGAADRERAVDVQHGRPFAAALAARLHLLGEPLQRCRYVRYAVAGARRARHDLRISEQLGGLRGGRFRRCAVGLGDRDDALLDPQRREHLRVLERLRHHAVVGGDDHEVAVDPGRPGHHRPHEALVARHVDDRDVPSGGQHEGREPELDRHAAGLLLGEAVGVDAGQRVHERRLAVVDVAGRPERESSVFSAQRTPRQRAFSSVGAGWPGATTAMPAAWAPFASRWS